MALISKIRKNSWLLVALIALGLIGFIITLTGPDGRDVLSQLTQSNPNSLGEINGREISNIDFNRTEQLLYGSSGGDVYARRNSLWNYFVEEAIVLDEAEELGLGVSKTELLDLEFGPNPSNIIRQRFADPATRQLNREQLNNIKKSIEDGSFTDPNMRAYWAHQETEITKERLQAKIGALVSKAIYIPTWMAEMGYQEQNQPIDIAYVKIPFDEIDNSEVSLSDEDFESYLKENPGRYKQDEETRKLEYTVFNVQATAADSAELKKRIADLIPDFQSAENDSAFVERNYGSISATFSTKEEVSPTVADTVFKLAVGTVYGPYVDVNAYQAVKVLDRRMIADSADTRHILLSATTPEEFAAAKRKLDSLENLLLSGASFDSLAIQFSQDPGSASNGGKYEAVTPNQFVPEYNDVLFVTGQIGKRYPVRTSYGWHLVEVLSRSANQTERVQLAFISEAIVPSEETQNALYDQVLQFVGQNQDIESFRKAVSDDPALEIEVSPSFKKNDFTVGSLGTGQASRDMIRWAFEAKVGAVSPEIYIYQDQVNFYNNKYVVAALKSVQKPGLPSVDNIRDEIEPQVLNKKKGEIIKGKVQGTSLPSIASSFKTQVDTAANVSFSAAFIPELGNEPQVIGKAYAMEQGQISKPIVGNAGVYVVELMKKPLVGAATNIQQIRQSMAIQLRNQIANQVVQAMKKNVEIEDNRFRFY
ncbi:MAG TPA: peptidylprolyl isomerase [Saprospiraceae bacterium]|nr:peptidylprolyl isomerase [Saprospiraceae bacterium]HMQ83958.1 peptidylprolyl isomerase [Saprospiraceae bacterium]